MPNCIACDAPTTEAPIRIDHATPVHVCMGCISARQRGVCHNCNSPTLRRTEQTLNNFSYCYACFTSGTAPCPLCNRRALTTSIVNGACETCWSNGAARCSSCSRVVAGDRLNWGTNPDGEGDDIPYCLRCFQALGNTIEDTTFNINKSKRYVGFELEFLSRSTPERLRGEVKRDGSVGSHSEDDQGQRGTPHEFAAGRARGDALLHNISASCASLARAGAFANRTCGFHVHLDMRESTPEQRGRIQWWWRTFEPMFYSMVAPSRRTSRFCYPVGLHETDRDWVSSRYHGLNITAYNQHGTYEARLHHGTVNKQKITNWILILLAFFDTFTNLPPLLSIRSYSERDLVAFFQKTCKLPPYLRKDMLARIKKHRKVNPIFHWPLSTAKKG